VQDLFSDLCHLSHFQSLPPVGSLALSPSCHYIITIGSLISKLCFFSGPGTRAYLFGACTSLVSWDSLLPIFWIKKNPEAQKEKEIFPVTLQW
jgi:hypothetical protein